MKLLKHPREMRKAAQSWRQSGKSIGFVPTMGGLHAGHLSLMDASIRRNAITIVSIFVNPAQFDSPDDFRNYPRNLEADLEILKSRRIEAIFAPDATEMFPLDLETTVRVEKLSQYLCGPFRPGHFEGVAVIVLKLFHLVLPTQAYFGEKDYQQLQIVRKMANDLNLDVEIVGCPTVREEDGLAMSSRNRLIPEAARKEAAILYRALRLGKEEIEQGERNAGKIRTVMEEKIREVPSVLLDYAEVCHPVTLEPLRRVQNEALLAGAIRLGKIRLIDNIVITDSPRFRPA